ncbi:MAG: PqqD family protein [Proteobacteria bacterium]|nr:PqqD family protein [Pseudomonadota bacterium]
MSNTSDGGNGFKINEELTWRDVDDQMVVLHLPTGKYYTFNEIGRVIWLSLTENKAEEEIIKIIIKEYEVSPEQAQKDIDHFIAGLSASALVTRE